MLQLPPESYNQISAFAFTFTKTTWEKAKLLLIGAILCPGRAPKKLTDWARQMLLWLGRYAKYYGRAVYLAGDGASAPGNAPL